MALPIKITPAFFTELEQIIQKRAQIAKEILKKNQSWRHHNPGLQDVSQSCNHQDSMVLTQTQTHRPMKQNRNPRNGPTTIWSTNR